MIDGAAPSPRLAGSESQKLGKYIRVNISCLDEGCVANASGTVRVPKIGATRAKLYKITKVTGVVPKGGTATVNPKLSNAARKAIKRALRRGRRITAKLEITVTDASGNARMLKRQVKLKL